MYISNIIERHTLDAKFENKFYIEMLVSVHKKNRNVTVTKRKKDVHTHTQTLTYTYIHMYICIYISNKPNKINSDLCKK